MLRDKNGKLQFKEGIDKQRKLVPERTIQETGRCEDGDITASLKTISYVQTKSPSVTNEILTDLVILLHGIQLCKNKSCKLFVNVIQTNLNNHDNENNYECYTNYMITLCSSYQYVKTLVNFIILSAQSLGKLC